MSYGQTATERNSPSVGVAVSPQHGFTDGPLLRAAGAALYQVKQAGRNQVVAAPLPA